MNEKLHEQIHDLANLFESVLLSIAEKPPRPCKPPRVPDADRMHDVIQKIVFQTSETWSGTAEDLCRQVLASNTASDADKELFSGASWTGRRLAELSLHFPNCYTPRHTRSGNLWKLRAVKE